MPVTPQIQPQPITDYSKRHLRLLQFFLVALFTCIVQLVAFNPIYNLYDDGILAFGAERILQGDMPYRDFWTMYAPGQFYVLAGLFAIFGTEDLTLRLYGLTLKAVITALSFSLVAKKSGAVAGIIAAASSFLILVAARLEAFPVFPAILLLQLALLSLPEQLGPAPQRLLATGVLIGLAALFRHDLGFYFCIGLTIYTCWQQFTLHANKTSALAGVLRNCYLYATGVLIIVFPVTLYLLLNVGTEKLWFNLILAPATLYAENRSLPWPGPTLLQQAIGFPLLIAEFVVYLPALLIPLFLFIVCTHKHRQSIQKIEYGFMLLLGICSLLFMLKGSVRVSAIHMLPAVLFSVLTLASLWPRLTPRARYSVPLAAVYLLSAGLVSGACLPGLTILQAAVKQNVSHWSSELNSLPCSDSGLPRGRCVSVDKHYQQAGEYILANTSASDLIYVAGGRHDKVFVNAVGLYFLTGRGSATYWQELHPGVQTQSAIQSQIIDELSKNRPALIVLDERWDEIQEPNASALSSGEHKLDTFIEGNFSETARFGPIRILQ